VRNHFEHMDERLHEWIADPHTYLVDQLVGPVNMHDLGGDRLVLRAFDHETGIVYAGGDQLALKPLSRECDRLYVRWKEIEGVTRATFE
jgi:hypothetical protein